MVVAAASARVVVPDLAAQELDRATVVVDFSVIDALGPADPSGAPVVLVAPLDTPPAASTERWQILFAGAAVDLPLDAGSVLEQIAAAADARRRVQIRAYAGGSADIAAQARSLSLDRALAIKADLVARGLRGSRIDIFALGDTAVGEPRNRADISFLD